MQRKPFGRYLDGFIRYQRNIMSNTTPPYVRSISDEGLRDEGRETMDQVGVVIIMGNNDLLRRSVSSCPLRLRRNFQYGVEVR